MHEEKFSHIAKPQREVLYQLEDLISETQGTLSREINLAGSHDPVITVRPADFFKKITARLQTTDEKILLNDVEKLLGNHLPRMIMDTAFLSNGSIASAFYKEWLNFTKAKLSTVHGCRIVTKHGKDLMDLAGYLPQNVRFGVLQEGLKYLDAVHITPEGLQDSVVDFIQDNVPEFLKEHAEQGVDSVDKDQWFPDEAEDGVKIRYHLSFADQAAKAHKAALSILKKNADVTVTRNFADQGYNDLLPVFLNAKSCTVYIDAAGEKSESLAPYSENTLDYLVNLLTVLYNVEKQEQKFYSDVKEVLKYNTLYFLESGDPQSCARLYKRAMSFFDENKPLQYELIHKWQVPCVAKMKEKTISFLRQVYCNRQKKICASQKIRH